ncbi:MAG TPA: IS21 family transposase [Candidatus Dormibacteraeota bacterium]|nr:IS21 family transposase [Candidatus Dormibacteraeota bacterium]
MVGVEQWAEIRRMQRVERLSIREISGRTGLHRKTIRRALAGETPPRYERGPSVSKLDPFRDWVCEQLRADPAIQSQRLRELACELGYAGGKTIFDDYVREVRPRFVRPRTFQRTVYRPGELVQCDLWEPRQLIAVGHGQTRRGWVVTAEVCWSRVIAGALIFSKEAPDVLWGVGRCLARIGALPERLVWDREGAIAPAGRPTDEFASFCGQLGIGWVILDRGDAQAKGALERSHRFMRSNFLPGRSFANPIDFQLQLDGWCDRVNRRVHRTIRAVPAERLVIERGRMRPLPARLADTDRRFVTRVPAQPYVRIDRNDYSIDPRCAGRRVEVRVTQQHVTAAVLDTGELACQHRRVFAGGLTFTDPAHQTELERQRARRRQRHEIDVEIRPLSRYDALIPA